MRDKYFSKVNEKFWEVKNDLSRNISYKNINLVENFHLNEKYDIILCRNVLIYQDISGKEEILSKLTKYLNKGGVLVLPCGQKGVKAEAQRR